MGRATGLGVLVTLLLCSGCGDDGDGGAASGVDGDGSAGGDGGDGSAEQLCVDTINMYRATLGLPPYARWTDGESCASDEAASDAASGEAHGAFGMCDESAQNECPGWPGPAEAMIEDCLDLMWAEGPGEDFQAHGHYINMSSTRYSEVACGFHVTDAGTVWSVQNFR